MTSKPLLSIVVLGYNQFDRTTGPCLNSLRPWIGKEDFEFIVFDNASPDGSGEKTRQWCLEYPTVIFHGNSKNLGYAGGMNQASTFASGKWLLLVNNDTEFPAGSLDAFKKVLIGAPKNLALIGPITNSAGNGQRLYEPNKNKQEWLELGKWLNSHPTGLYIPTNRCDFFCVAIRSDAWKLLSGLDLAFGRGYYEDFDFSLRLCQHGFEQAITEDVFIYHQGSASFSSNPEQHALIKRNKNIMKRRYPGLKFKHVRECNLDVLQDYRKLSSLDLTEENLLVRRKIRQAAAKSDLPKSQIKRLFWQWHLFKSKLF
jgi:GT2 family glycosyltransferase